MLLRSSFGWCDRRVIKGRSLVKGRPPSLCFTRAARILKIHSGLLLSSKAVAGGLLLGSAVRSQRRGLAVRCILCGLPSSRGWPLLGLRGGLWGVLCWPALGQAVKVCGPGITVFNLHKQLLDVSVLLAKY